MKYVEKIKENTFFSSAKCMSIVRGAYEKTHHYMIAFFCGLGNA